MLQHSRCSFFFVGFGCSPCTPSSETPLRGVSIEGLPWLLRPFVLLSVLAGSPLNSQIDVVGNPRLASHGNAFLGRLASFTSTSALDQL
jgi:hypothetical protein